MRATGIVRRIDDLGRVVVPKEIRRNLKIREGDPLEIFTDRDGEVVLKKYSPMGEIKSFAVHYAESLGNYTEHTIIITDRDVVIAAAGGCKELIDKNLSKEFENILEERIMVKENTKKISVTDGEEPMLSKIIQPIICEGDVIGSVVMMLKGEYNKITDADCRLVMVASDFLGRQME
jgi:AbrB family transcriptional regulator (stage V sporulation protein T)